MDGSNRRRSDGAVAGTNKPAPALQVVGFHVEGGSSPQPTSLLANDSHPVGAGSPTPVIIPPSFQSTLSRDSSASRSTQSETAATKALESSTSVGGALHSTASAPPSAPVSLTSISEGGSPLPAVAADSLTAAPMATFAPTTSASQIGDRADASASASPQKSEASTVPSSSSTTSQNTASAPPAAAGDTSRPKGPRGAPPEGVEPKPKLSKAEMRAKQEAQRAAKAAAKEAAAAGQPSPSSPRPQQRAAVQAAAGSTQQAKQASDKGSKEHAAAPPAAGSKAEAVRKPAAAASDATASAVSKRPSSKVVVASLNSVELFAHLQQYKKVSASTLLMHKDAGSIHPSVLQLGLHYANGTISGANARCQALLHTVCQVIQDYSTPEGKSLSRDLTSQLNTMINFLVECRPLSASMGNAIKFLKLRISKIDPSKPEDDAKHELINDIQDFINVRITGAAKLLVATAVNKVEQGDVVLTYAYSHVVFTVLSEAQQQGKRFHVVVVDSRPELEGRLMLKKLLQAGIACSYVQLNAVSFVIRDVNKVFLGAAAVMSNGTVMGRAGAASVAMMAQAHSKPVMICCESYKFHERVQLDSITHNELGDPEALASVPGRPDITALKGWKDQLRLGLLNLKYDAMPAEYVTMIVTEFGMIPPTSVPVILREYRHAEGMT